MNQGQFVFSQVFSFVSHNDFIKCVNKYHGDYKTKRFSCWKQFLCMAFGQLTHRESLSDTVLCIKSNSKKLYHLGIGSAISKSTLSKANENRDWRIFRDYALLLIDQAKGLYTNDNQLEVDIKNNVFGIDSTVIDLCLSVFSWAKFRKTKAAVKVHAMLDLKTSIPDFIHITDASVHDINMLDLIEFQPESFYIMDRAYLDFKRFNKINSIGAYFVTRARKDFTFTRIYSAKTDKSQGILCDQTIRLTNFYVSKAYPAKFRRIKYYDAEKDQSFVFLTNNFMLKAFEIATLYKHRWFIELFFKWIKQHLKIKSFWGQSQNAVKTQIWIAISVYVIVAIMKKRLALPQSMYEILQVLSINILDKESISQILAKPDLQNFKEPLYKQLTIFD